MGLGGISVWQLGIILLIVILLFGTKRIKQLGTDLGGAIKGLPVTPSPARWRPTTSGCCRAPSNTTDRVGC